MREEVTYSELIRVKALWALMCSVWMTIPAAFQLMLIFMAFDAITALINPTVKFKRRVITLSLSLLLALMVQIAWYYAMQHTKFNIGIDLVAGVCAFYSLGSAVDIVVNFDAAGVYIPPILLNLMRKAQGLTGRERSDLDTLAKHSDE